MKNNSKIKIELQRWRGHVIKLTEFGFFARLEDMTAGGTDEEGEFMYDHVDESQHFLIVLGAYFDWVIGTDENQQPISEITFMEKSMSFAALKTLSGLLKDEISDEQMNEMLKDVHR